MTYRRRSFSSKTRISPPTGIEVGLSAGRGRGIFATKNFKRGDIIEVAPVLDLGYGAAEYNLLDFTKVVSYVFQADDDNANSHSVIGLGYASLYNHSKRPNADWRITPDVFTVRACQDIPAKTEIFIDYGWGDEQLAENGVVD